MAESYINFGNYKAKMQLRPYPKSSQVYDELTTENERITLDESGKITVKFPAAVTAEYKFDKAVYDLYVMSPDGHTYRIVEGIITARQGVTKWQPQQAATH